MKEAIIRLNSDHIKVKGAEYVQDLVRCKDCKKSEPSGMFALIDGTLKNIPSLRCKAFELERDGYDFCSYGEREGE